MNKEIKFDPKKAMSGAHKTAREQERRAQALLWDRITDRAAADKEFRRQLIDDPKEAVSQEVHVLKAQEGTQFEIASQVIDAVTEKARAVYSEALPGVGEGKVETLIFETIEDIRKSFKLTLRLSQVLFYAGLAMIVTAFIVALVQGDKTISLFFGAGGMVGVLISSLVMSPLNRVQDAASDLVQLQMAYLAYYKHLVLLGGKCESITPKEAVMYTKELVRNTTAFMSSLQTYVEKTGSQLSAGKTDDQPEKGKQG